MRSPDASSVRRTLLAWYRTRRRDLPFRRTHDPYAILVAEVLLQRTRVAAGLPYYERFLAAFPDVRALAAAPEADVLRVWEGLGFYRRARNLHHTAKAIVDQHDGRIPPDFEALRTFPGVGDYTAGAVASIAFGLPVPAVDGNVTRVLARVYRMEEDVSRALGKRRIRALAAGLVPPDAPGEWNQALMEIGATVCLPRAPRCLECPISDECLAFAAGAQEQLPAAAARKPVPAVPVVFAVVRRGNSILVVRRSGGLHAGMYALPGGTWASGEADEAAMRRHLRPFGIHVESLVRLTSVRHTFSHLRWEGIAFRCEGRGTPEGAEWVSLDRIAHLPVVPLHRRLLERTIAPAPNP